MSMNVNVPIFCAFVLPNFNAYNKVKNFQKGVVGYFLQIPLSEKNLFYPNSPRHANTPPNTLRTFLKPIFIKIILA